ncbi:MAG: helix-turn-helix domain-containing protein [Myxococcales bacterium]|nr:helix-turn-helix domain-containing protein [Myxococcales bacterium]
MSKVPDFHDFQRAIGARLRELRVSRGWTQERAANHVGLNIRHWQKAESGSVNLTIRTLHRIAAAFDVAPADLL